MNTSVLRSTVLVATAAAILASSTAAQEPAHYQKLIDERGPALVTIKYLLRTKIPGMSDREEENEVAGIMIRADGLVLCSNAMLTGYAAMMSRMQGGEVTSTPADLRVMIGDSTEELKAELVARDSELDLAWVRLTEPGDRQFAAIDFAQAAEPHVGEEIATVQRMGKFYDRAPVARSGRIGGVTRRPRLLYIPDGAVGTELCQPIFNRAGQPIGLAVLQMPGAEDMASGGMAGAQARMILPAETVVKATARALEVVEED